MSLTGRDLTAAAALLLEQAGGLRIALFDSVCRRFPCCLARLVAAMLALPAEVVEQFYAAWETG
jgi:hypothetical protein